MVWTLTSRGKTERAYGTLKSDYFIDDIVIQNNNGAGGAGGGAPDTIGNKPPINGGDWRQSADGSRRRAGDADGVCQRRWEAETEADADAA